MKNLLSILLFLSISITNSFSQISTIVSSNSLWKYLDNGSDQGTSWRDLNFNDNSWSQGNAPLGFGNAYTTLVSSGKIGYYFRQKINLNPNSYSSLNANIKRDDGIVVYINNNEVYRNNMPSGTISYNTVASSTCSDDGKTTFNFPISNSVFINGDNIIAVEIHNRKTSSSDITFQLELLGTPTGSATCNAPPSLSTSNIANTTATLNWGVVPGAVSYNVRYRETNVISWSTVNISSNTFSLNNLTSGTNYEFQIQTVCSSGSSSYSLSSNFTTTGGSTGTCGLPNVALFGTTQKTATSARPDWVAVSGAQSYNVQYRIRNIGAPYSTSINTSTNYIVLTGLQPSTNYEFIVQTVCTSGSSTFSPSGWFTTLVGTSTTCDIPNLLLASNITNTSATLNWSSVQNSLNYNFRYRVLGSTNWITSNVSIASTSINNLNASTNYEFQVQTVCASGNSLYSSSGNFITTGGSTSTCSMPNVALFNTTQKTNVSAVVGWASISGAQSYNVEYRIRNIGAPYSASINTTTNSLMLTGLQSSTNYEFTVQTVCASGVSTFSPSGWFTTTSGSSTNVTLIRGPYMTTPTSSANNIHWRTNTPSNSEVKYGTTVGNLTSTASNTSSVTDHIITLTGLQPNTKYYYSVGVIGAIIQGDANNFFYTAPSNGSSTTTKFWITGDFGNGSSGQTAVRNSFTNYIGSQPMNGWLWLGDNAYDNGTDAEYQSKVFNVYTSLFKNLPTFPALGNHDYAQAGYLSSASRGINFPYFTIFKLPTNGDREKYYSTNYGNIHFIALDSYGSYNTVGSAMYNWLQADLAANTQLWTVVYFHHPPYSKGSHNSDSSTELVDMRNNIIPLLEQYGVDVVLSGHSHAYERSFFMKGHFGLENTFSNSMKVQSGDGISTPYTKTSRTGPGTVYVVCGVSGQVGGTSSGYPHNAMQYSTSSTNGSLILEVNGGVLNCKFLTSSGSIPDQFTITKTGLARVVNSNGMDNITTANVNLTIYPNPTNSNINIEYLNKNDFDQFCTVQIFNSIGKEVYESNRQFSSNENALWTINKSEFNSNPGIYYIKVSSKNDVLYSGSIIIN